MKPFEFVIPIRPVSAQARRAKRRGDWQNALIGLAYEDDVTITDLVIRRRSLQETMELANVTPVLAQAIDTGDEFVYVRIEDAPDQSRLK